MARVGTKIEALLTLIELSASNGGFTLYQGAEATGLSHATISRYVDEWNTLPLGEWFVMEKGGYNEPNKVRITERGRELFAQLDKASD